MSSLPVAPLIERAAIDALVNRIIDPVIGFNPQYAQVKASDPRFSDIEDVAIDTDPDTTGNFIIGKISNAHDLLRTANRPWPVFNVWVANTVNQPSRRDRPKNYIFWGDVHLGMDVHMMWTPSETLDDYEIGYNAINAALFTIMNYSGYMTRWPANARWTQELQLTSKSGVERAGANWYERGSYSLRFIVSG